MAAYAIAVHIAQLVAQTLCIAAIVTRYVSGTAVDGNKHQYNTYNDRCHNDGLTDNISYSQYHTPP